MKNGFTLVELSIVLVIIGLLVGGILIGQSLIDSAKINAQVRQIQQYDIIAQTFIDRFRQIPGDSNIFTPQGNNDGTFGVGGFNLSAEARAFWRHVGDSGLTQDKYSEDFTPAGTAGVNYPEAELDRFIIVASNLSGGPTSAYSVLPNAQNNLLWYTSTNYGPTGGLDSSSFTGTNVVTIGAIDIKIDDGIPLMGNMNAFTGNSSGNLCFDIADTSAGYPYDNPDAICTFIVPLGSGELY